MSMNSIEPATSFSAVTVNTVLKRCRGVYIGVANSYDFSVDGSTWVAFKNMVAGTVLPLSAVSVRLNSGGGAIASGDVIFLY